MEIDINVEESEERKLLGSRALSNNDKLAHGAFETLKLLETWQSARRETAKYFRYVANDMWEKEIRDNLISKGITPITINKIIPRLNRIYGHVLENSGRLQAFPLEGANQEDAVMASKLFEELDIDGDFTNATMDAYIDASVGKMGGWAEAYYHDDGTPCVEKISPFHVLPDPAVSFSRQSYRARRICKVDWKSLDDIIYLFPEKEDEIMAVADRDTGAVDFYAESGMFWETTSGPDVNLQEELFNRKENLYRTIEMYYRKTIPVYSVEIPSVGEIGPFTQAVAREVAHRLGGLRVTRGMKKIVKKMIMMADLVLLHEEVLDVQNGQFPIFGMGFYEFSGLSFSLVSILQPIIDEINQARTTMNVALHMSAMPWFHSKRGALSPEMKRRLEKYRGMAGLHVESEPGYPDPYNVQGGDVHPGQYTRLEVANRDIEEISGVDATMIAQQGKNEPLGTTLLRNENLGRVLKMSYENKKRMTVDIGRYVLDMYREAGNNISFRDASGEMVEIDASLLRGKKLGVKFQEVDKSLTRKKVEFGEMTTFVQTFIPPQMFPSLLPILVNATDWEGDTKKALLDAVDSQNEDRLNPQQQAALQRMLTQSSLEGV